MINRSMFKGAALVGAAILLSACEMAPAHMTGGGTMHSLGGDGRAQLAFTADGCDVDNVKGQLQFGDRTAIEWQANGGVKLHGNVTSAGMCTEEESTDPDNPFGDPGCGTSQLGECDPGQMAILFDYDSTNPAAPGAGEGLVCAQSAGPGAGGSLHAIGIINLQSGPYEGYANLGALVGNAQVHGCQASG